MKKRLFTSLLALLMLLPLLAAAPTAGADAPLTLTDTCDTHGEQAFEFVGYSSNRFGSHAPSYRCPYCRTSLWAGAYLEPCSGGTATCTQRKRCSICWGEYGELAPHEMEYHGMQLSTCTESGWYAYDACKNCGYSANKVTIPTLPHSYEDTAEAEYLESVATCVSKARYYSHCSYCNQRSSSTFEAGDVDLDNHDLEHHEGKAPTCTETGWAAYDTCKRENCGYTSYQEISALDHDRIHHDGRAPTCTEKGWAAYDTCKREGCNYTSYQELPALNHDRIHHDAQAPTCTEIGWEAYDTCSRCDYTTYEELPANSGNHDLSHVKAKAPTCTDHGWEAYDVCKRCGYNTIKELPALGHWYGEWAPNGSHTHLASCKRGCGHRAATTCAALDYALLTEGADAYEFTLCPVCGEVSDGALLKLIDQTTAQPLTRWLPAGEQVLRLGTLENGELLLTAAFEISGQLTKPTGIVQFTLPAEHLEGFTLTILHPDGTEEPLPYTVAGKTATFTLDFTDQEVPAMILHLMPEA